MKKRALCLVLCLCMALALLPSTAFAATTAVSIVNLTLKSPILNQLPTDASVPDNASTVVTGTRWVGHRWGDEGKFLSVNCDYGAFVTVRIKDGQDKVFAKKMTLNINGHASGSEDTGAHKEETYLISMSEDRKEIEVFVNFDMPVVGGFTAGNRKFKVGDSLTRESSVDRLGCTAENITVRSVPESPDGTVQPYSWIITDIDIRAKEGYLLETLKKAKENVGKTKVFCDWEASGYVADYVYTDLFNAHVTYYQWIGSGGEEVTDQMRQQRDKWLWKNDGTYGTYNNEPEIGTGKRRDFLNGRLSSEWRNPANNGVKDKRAYVWAIPCMKGTGKWMLLEKSFGILDDHAERDFPGAVGQWYLIRQGKKIGYIPAAYVEGANTPSTPDPPKPSSQIAYPSTQTVDIDGRKVEFQMYALKDANGYPTNYIKARDLALALNGTQAQFAIEWDGKVNLVSKSAYTPNGSENKTPFSGERAYTVPTGATNVNGSTSDLTAIFLTDDSGGGYTYYQLRDLGRKLGFNVDWSGEKGAFIETDKPYNEK